MKAKRVRKLDPQEPLVENAARILRTRLDEMRSFAHGALQAENETEQHDLRIAAKRLRYVLEATGFCFGAPADTARRRARDLQDVLGELHDCDVMLPRIADHVESLRSEDAEAVRESAGDAKDLEPALVARAPAPHGVPRPRGARRSGSRRGGGCCSAASSSSGPRSSAPPPGSGSSARSTAVSPGLASAARSPSGPSGPRWRSSAPSGPSARRPNRLAARPRSSPRRARPRTLATARPRRIAL